MKPTRDISLERMRETDRQAHIHRREGLEEREEMLYVGWVFFLSASLLAIKCHVDHILKDKYQFTITSTFGGYCLRKDI